MKNIALIATSLALLSAGALAHDNQPTTKTVKVTNGSVVTLYSLSAAELTGKESYTAQASVAVVNDKTREYAFSGNVMIQLGKSLKIYADKALMKTGDRGYPSITLQSDGKIESQDGEHKVVQFAADGTSIEFVESK